MIESELIRGAIERSAIHPDVEKAIEKQFAAANVYTPTELTAGIAEVMRSIRNQSDPTVKAQLVRDEAKTTEEALFVDINNAVQKPSYDDEAIMFTQRGVHSNPGACSFAEPRFAGILHSLQTGRHDTKWGRALVFRDNDGAPLLLQKFFESDNALGLTEIAIDGITYPAGTLYSVYSAVGKRLHRRYINGDWPHQRLRVLNIAASDVDSIAPLRLSLFAIPPDEYDREPDFDSITSVAHPEYDTIKLSREASVEDFATALS